MNINFSGYNYRRSIQAVNRQQGLISIFLNKQKAGNAGMRDSFLRTNNSAKDIGLYTASSKKVSGYVSNSILDMLNFEYRDCKGQTADSFTFGGVEYPKSKIPGVSADRCSEIKAENNTVAFQTGKYYKFTDENGKTHVLSCSYDRLKQPYSDTSRGIVDDTSGI